MSRRLFAAAAFAAASLVFAGPAPATTNPAATVTIKVTITDRAVTMIPGSVTRGIEAEFILTNRGTKTHTLVVRDAGVGARPSFRATLRPDQQKTFVLFLDYRGLVHYFSPETAALKGTLRVV